MIEVNDRVRLTQSHFLQMGLDVDTHVTDVYHVDFVFIGEPRVQTTNERTGEEFAFSIEDVEPYKGQRPQDTKFYALLEDMEAKRVELAANITSVRTTLDLQPYGDIEEEWSTWVATLTSDIRILLDQLA